MDPATTGFYSLVQYCPDRSRSESANLGVVLVCPALGYLGFRMAKANDRLRRFFGEQVGNLAQVHAMKRMLENRLKSDRDLLNPENFEKFRKVLSNELQISEPRPLRVENPQSELAQLFSELVEVREHHEPMAKPAAFEHLDEVLLSERFAPLIRRDVKIHVPILDREIEVPYTYQNGRLNLIQTHHFNQRSEAPMIQDACKTAVQGHLLFRNPLPDLGACQLVVVGSFGPASAETRDRIQRILKEHDVDFYAEDHVDELTQRILETAH